MAEYVPKIFEPLGSVFLEPKELVAPLALDLPLELALMSDAATRKVYEVLPRDLLEGKTRVRSSLYWSRAGVPQSWHVDFCTTRVAGESLRSYQRRVSGHRNLLFAFDPCGVTTDFVVGAQLGDLFDDGERVSTPEVHQRVCSGSYECISVPPGQFIHMNPDQIHRRGFNEGPSHFRRIVVFHDLESNGPQFLSPLARLVSTEAREAYKAIMRP